MTRSRLLAAGLSILMAVAFAPASGASVSPAKQASSRTAVPRGNPAQSSTACPFVSFARASACRSLLAHSAALPAAPVLTAGPPVESYRTSGSVSFTGESGATFECSVNDGPFAACTSPTPISGIVTGQNLFRVRAVTAGGTGDATAYRWNVDPRTTGAVQMDVGQVPDTTTYRLHSCAVLATGEVKCWGSNRQSLGDGTTSNRLEATTVSGIAVGGVSNAVQVSSGDGFSCALLGDGTVKCWGYNGNGQLGINSTTSTTSAGSAVSGLSGVIQITTGTSNVCALLISGRVKCWGRNDSTVLALGDGSSTQRTTPVEVLNVAGATKIASASHSSCALIPAAPGASSGGLRCWGYNASGQLGDGTTTARNAAVVPTDMGSGVVDVQANDMTTCAKMSNGDVRCTGENSSGQFGNGTSTSATTFTKIPALSNVDAFTLEGEHGCGVVAGALKCWGYNLMGQLGDGTTDSASVPVTVKGTPLSGIKQLSGHYWVSCALLSGGAIKCWGRNDQGQLGDGTGISSFTPVNVKNLGVGVAPPTLTAGPATESYRTSANLSFSGDTGATFQCSLDGAEFAACTSPKSFTGLAAGKHTFAVRQTTTAGTGEAAAYSWSVDPHSSGVVQIASGVIDAGSTSPPGNVRAQTCAVTATGDVKCWGPGLYGVGDGTASNRLSAVSVSGVSDAVQVAGGSNFSCALIVDGAVRCWGRGSEGQLGNGGYGSNGNSSLSVAVSGLSGAVRIASGRSFACAIVVTGKVKCWGWNGASPLGDLTTTNRPTPVDAQYVTGAVKIVAGYDHACSLLQGGAVRCWGENGNGQLGDGSTTDRAVPMVPSGMSSGVADLFAAGNYTCAQMDTGEVRCSGDNGDGQFGNGSTTSTTTFTTVGALSGVSKLSLQEDHACGVLSGVLKCWGDNVNGQLGDGTMVTRLVPTTVAGSAVTAVRQLAGSAATSCALQDSGGVKCWGRNDVGQAGDATAVSTLSPVWVKGLGAVTTPPDLTSGPAVDSYRTSGSFSFTGEAGASFQCSLDGAEFASCTSPRGFSGLSAGRHTFSVRQIASSGPSEASSYAWSVDPRGSGVVQISGGKVDAGALTPPGSVRAQTCALLASGEVRCWGPGLYGIGDGSTSNRYSAVTVSGVSDAVQVVTGNSFSCALIADGTAKCWGRSAEGELGNGQSGTGSNSTVAVDVSNLQGAVQLAAGNGWTCALLVTRRVKCWGYNNNNQLADQTTSNRATPVESQYISGAVKLVAGWNHACAIVDGGALKCWGGNSLGQLGDTTTADRSIPTVPAGMASGVSDVLAGANTTCAAMESGEVRCTGDNSQGQFGNNSTSSVSSFTRVPALEGAAKLAIEEDHACAIFSGTLKCWGDNATGELGDGTMTDRLVPTTLVGSQLSGIRQLTGSGVTSCAMLDDGSVRCWGRNDLGQAGDGTAVSTYTPVPVSGVGAKPSPPTITSALDSVTHLTAATIDFLGDDSATFECSLDSGGWKPCSDRSSASVANLTNGSHQFSVRQTVDGRTSDAATLRWKVAAQYSGAVQVVAGSNHTCTLIADGAVKCWGDNSQGQVTGTAGVTAVTAPTTVAGISNATSIALGEFHSCALVAGGSVKCWGKNSSGQLGDGTTTTRTGPVDVKGSDSAILTGAYQIAAASSSACALFPSGVVKCWGSGAGGQLANLGTADLSLATPAQYLPPATKISAGSNHYCALLLDATVRCWGKNSDGRLGDGSTTDRSVPVSPLGIANVLDVFANYLNTCVRQVSGSYKCWGPNSDGQLGDGSTNSTVTPTIVTSIASASSISESGYSMCGIFTGSTVKCWGNNTTGQLGDGTTTSRYLPTSVAGLSDVVEVTTGGSGSPGTTDGKSHACARTSTGSIKCWGYNGRGQLGDGTTTNQLTPVTLARSNFGSGPLAPRISKSPGALTNQTSTSIEFDGDSADAATFECSVDGSTPAACASPVNLTGLSGGKHSFGVRQSNQTGGSAASATTSVSWTIDTVKPDAPVITGLPAQPVATRTFVVRFTTEAGATAECSLDAGDWVACTSPVTLNDVRDGTHTFSVRQTDAAGNVSPEASKSFVVVADAPAAPVVTPDRSVPTNSRTMRFDLAPPAGTTLECAVDGGAWSACISPYSVNSLSDGTHSFSARSVVTSVSSSSVPTTFTWSVDTSPPAPPSVTGAGGLTGMDAYTTDTATQITIAPAETGGRIECRRDGGQFSASGCDSPVFISGLLEGTYTFSARQVDAAGNISDPGVLRWTVDRTSPNQPGVTGIPVGTTKSASVSAAFTGETGATFACRLDSEVVNSNCGTAFNRSGLSDGPHTLVVTQRDRAGNSSQSASVSWTVDTNESAPVVAYLGSTPTSSTDASFELRSTMLAGSRLQCQIDPAASTAASLEEARWTPCPTPFKFSELRNGAHKLWVRIQDASFRTKVENYVALSWSVDLVAPSAPQLKTTVTPGSTGSRMQFEFTGEPGAKFSCALGSESFSPCDSGVSFAFSDSSIGTFKVRQTDVAGNVGTTASPVARPTVVASPVRYINKDTLKTASFTFTSALRVTCALDGMPALPACASGSPFSVSGVGSEGEHVFSVTGTDPATGSSSTLVQRWIVDLTAPTFSGTAQCCKTPGAGTTTYLLPIAPDASPITQVEWNTSTKAPLATAKPVASKVIPAAGAASITITPSTPIVIPSTSVKWLRVMDAAGNWSNWVKG